MADRIKHYELGAARLTYDYQRRAGSPPDAALNLAVIGYLKRNRNLSSEVARIRLAEALGLEISEQ